MNGSGLPRWLRLAALAGSLLLVIVAGWSAWRYASRPTTFTVAAGAADSELNRMMAAIGGRLAANRARVRLKLVEKETPLAAAKAFAASEVDLAILRGDLVETSTARTVFVVAHAVLLMVVAGDGPVKDMDGLEGKTVGVVEGDLNRRVVEALSREYDLADAKVRFLGLDLGQARRALQSGEVAALLMVMPVSERYLPVLRELFPRNARPALRLLPIEAAPAMAALTRAFESFELPKGAVRGSPPIPDEDLATLRLPYYLLAREALADERVAELATAMLEARRDLMADYPLIGQLSTPSVAKDADIPVHPGARAYFEGEQKSFFDRYGDQLFYGTLLLGMLGSLLAGAWRYFGFGEAEASPLEALYSLGERVRAAGDERELAAIEDELDALLREELTGISRGETGTAEAAALTLVVQRLEAALERRRAALGAGGQGATAPQPGLAAQGVGSPPPAS
jgi:TRAP-type uncharacterized transport system substrate-binding protein